MFLQILVITFNFRISLRLKFEAVWRKRVSVCEKPFDYETKKEASNLVSAIIDLCTEPEQYEYGWLSFEKAPYLDWKVIVAGKCELYYQGIKLCRRAPKTHLWNARCFAMYRRVIEFDSTVIKGSPEYITFMKIV